MKASEIVSAYERLLSELSEAVAREDWESIGPVQDRIEALQTQFDALPATQKQQSVVQDGLRMLVAKQEKITARVVKARSEAAQHLRKFQSAKTQQQGYLYKGNTSVPPVYVDRKK